MAALHPTGEELKKHLLRCLHWNGSASSDAKNVGSRGSVALDGVARAAVVKRPRLDRVVPLDASTSQGRRLVENGVRHCGRGGRRSRSAPRQTTAHDHCFRLQMLVAMLIEVVAEFAARGRTGLVIGGA